MTEDTPLEEMDRLILDIIQTGFPITSHPYENIGQKLGISEEEALSRVRKMRRAGIIRRLGANFQSGRLGFFSTLCAAHVPAAKKSLFVERVNSEKGVTHNYERDHHWNIWFTLIAPSREAVQELLKGIEADTGVAIVNLPAVKLYKINVDFPMTKGSC